MCLLSWVYSILLLFALFGSVIVCQTLCSFIVVTYIHLYEDLCFSLFIICKGKKNEINTSQDEILFIEDFFMISKDEI